MFNNITSRVSSVRITDLLTVVINDSNNFTLLAYKANCNITLFYHFRI